jgi:hypothetical protein
LPDSQFWHFLTDFPELCRFSFKHARDFCHKFPKRGKIMPSRDPGLLRNLCIFPGLPTGGLLSKVPLGASAKAARSVRHSPRFLLMRPARHGR